MENKGKKENNIEELQVNKELFDDLLRAYIDETIRLKMLTKTKEVEMNQVIPGKFVEFDLTIQIDSLLALKKQGWPVKFSPQFQIEENYKKLTNINGLTVAVLGPRNSGKTFFLSHITNIPFKSTDSHHKSISIKFPNEVTRITFIDTNFTDYPYVLQDNNKEMKDHDFTEDFLSSFIIEKANIIFYMVEIIEGSSQKSINIIKNKLESFLNSKKKIFFIHNLQRFSTADEIEKYYNELLRDCFNLKNYPMVEEKDYKRSSYEGYFFAEPKQKYIHFIIAKGDSPVGLLYNQKSFNNIKQQMKIQTKEKKFNFIEDFRNHFQKKANIYFAKSPNANCTIKLQNNQSFVLEDNQKLVLSENKLNKMGTKLMKSNVFYPPYRVSKDKKNNMLKIVINVPCDSINLNISKNIIGGDIHFHIKGKHEPEHLSGHELMLDFLQVGEFEVQFDIPFTWARINDDNYKIFFQSGLYTILYNLMSSDETETLEF